MKHPEIPTPAVLHAVLLDFHKNPTDARTHAAKHGLDFYLMTGALMAVGYINETNPPTKGRPERFKDPADLLVMQKAVKVFGNQNRAAQALDLKQSTFSRYLNGVVGVPPRILRRTREAIESIEGVTDWSL